jgi:2-polyprenyl-6-methoxyphenol hydroxylase-like FAD-dependent oxidoreductase
MATQKPILIAGAGISSLAFAQGLLKLAPHLPFRIFERDPALNVRSQGYRVRINPVGTTALKTVLPPHLYARLQGSCAILNKDEKPLVGGQGPVMHLDAITGEEMEFHFHGKGGPPAPRMPDGETLNADRTVLRSVLASGLESRIEFGKAVSGFETRPDGVILRFSDGSQVEGCLLVGADGTKSKIRQQLLPGYDFVDTEGRWFYGKTTLTPELEARFNKHCLKGLTLVQDKTRQVGF